MHGTARSLAETHKLPVCVYHYIIANIAHSGAMKVNVLVVLCGI